MSNFTNVISQVFIDFIDLAIGHTSISDIGDGTLKGAVRTLQTNKAPTDHSSVSTGYGLGEPTKYGHVKTINNLTTNSFSNGEALSAYQGYLLKTQLDNSVGGNKFIYATCTTGSSTQVKTITLPANTQMSDGDILFINFANSNSYEATSSGYVTFSIDGDSYEIASLINPTTGDITKPIGINTDYYGAANQTHMYKVDVTNGVLLFIGHSADNEGENSISVSSTEPTVKTDNLIWIGGD